MTFVNGMPGPFPSEAKGMAPPKRVPAPTYDAVPSSITPAPWERHDPKWGAGGVARNVTANVTSTAPPASTKQLKPQPAWLKFDSMQLHFGGYFEDLEVTKRTGELRVRRCVVTYHLEDGSIDIREPRSNNSGLEQGRILHRMRVMKPDGSGVMTPSDLNVGSVPVIFKREYHILACDEFTRKFLEREELTVPAELPFPEQRDPNPPQGQFKSAPSIVKAPESSALFSMDLNVLGLHDDLKKPLPGSQSHQSDLLKESAGRQFLSLDGNVLRFFCTSSGNAQIKNGDDTRTDGKLKAFTLHYFLADDTVEVLEVLPSGVEDYSKVLRRQRLPKKSTHAGGGFGVGIRPASQDTIKRGGVAGNVTWRDLSIGAEVNVFGKILTIHDCDAHTQTWYKQELGVSDTEFEPLPVPQAPVRKPRAPPPVHTSGIGSDVDSLQYCLRLVPKAQPTMDFDSWRLNSGSVLRFTGTFVDTLNRKIDEIDATRTFVVSFYLEDNTVAVYEPPVPNSGLPGGPFYKRNALKKVNSLSYYSASDFVVGAVVTISGRALRLNGADDATFSLMESRPNEFPKSDFVGVVSVAQNLLENGGRAARDALRKAAAVEDMKLAGGGAMALSRDAFVEVMTATHTNLESLDAQSLVTLWRHLPKSKIDVQKTRVPESFKSVKGADANAEYVDVDAVFSLLNVPWVETKDE